MHFFPIFFMNTTVCPVSGKVSKFLSCRISGKQAKSQPDIQSAGYPAKTVSGASLLLSFHFSTNIGTVHTSLTIISQSSRYVGTVPEYNSNTFQICQVDDSELWQVPRVLNSKALLECCQLFSHGLGVWMAACPRVLGQALGHPGASSPGVPLNHRDRSPGCGPRSVVKRGARWFGKSQRILTGWERLKNILDVLYRYRYRIFYIHIAGLWIRISMDPH